MKNLFTQYKGLRRELYIIAFGRIVTSLGCMIWPMLTLILSNKLDMSASDTASALLIMNIIQIPCIMCAGYLADHYSKRNIIIVCDFVTVFSYFIIAFLDISMTTVIFMFIAGLFAMMEQPAYDALIADLSSSKDRERAFSLNYLSYNLGLILAPTIGGLLFADYLQLSFFIDGASTLCSTLLIILFIKNENISKIENEEYEKKENSSLFSVLKVRKVIFFALFCYMFIELIYSQYLFLLPLNLEQLYGEYGALLYGTLTSVNAIIVVCGTPILTSLLKNISDINKILYSVLLFSFSLSLYIFIQGNIPMYFVSIVIFTLGEDINSLGNQPYLTKRIPSSHRARIFSLKRILAAILVAVSQKGMGILIDNYSMTFLWTLVSLVSILGILLVLILRYFDKKEYQFK